MKRLSIATALFGASMIAFGVPTIDGQITSDSGWTAADIKAKQTNYTGFGDNFSELDVLYAKTDDDFLYIGITGNMENNGNNVLIFLDTAPGGTIPYTLNFDCGPNCAARGTSGMTFDGDFAPEWIYQINNYQGTLYENIISVENNTTTYIGSTTVDTGPYVPTGGEAGGAPFIGEYALNNTNAGGVSSFLGDPGNLDGSNASNAGTGLEIKVPLSALNIRTLCKIRLAVWLTGGAGNLDTEGTYGSNQALPALNAGDTSTEYGNTAFVKNPNAPFTANFGFNQAPGNQYVEVTTPANISASLTLADLVGSPVGLPVAITSSNPSNATKIVNTTIGAGGTVGAAVVANANKVRIKVKGYLSVLKNAAPCTDLGAVNVPFSGDTNDDDNVDDFDLANVIFDFGNPPSGNNGYTDVNRDGKVDDFDLAQVIFNFGKKGEGL